MKRLAFGHEEEDGGFVVFEAEGPVLGGGGGG